MSDLRGAFSEKVRGSIANNVEDENNVQEEKIILHNVSVMYQILWNRIKQSKG